MNNRSRSTLFLMEQLLAILVFAICAAACVKIFVGSYIIASESKDMNKALLIAESAAECYKAAAGDVGEAAAILDGNVSAAAKGYVITVYYNKQWQECEEDQAAYVMRLTSPNAPENAVAPVVGDISVEKITGEVIIAITAAARGRTG